MTTYTINPEFNGLELRFDAKPEQSVIDQLKANRWRWHSVKKCWYTRQSEAALVLAQSIAEGEATEATATATTTDKTTTGPAYHNTICDYLTAEEYRAKLSGFYAAKGEQYTAFNSSEKAIEYRMENHYSLRFHLKYVRQAIIWKSLGHDARKFYCNGDSADYSAIWDKLPTIKGLKLTGREYAAMWGYDQTQITTAAHYEIGRAHV